MTRDGLVLPDRRREPPRVYVELVLRIEYSIGEGTPDDPIRVVTSWFSPVERGVPRLLFTRDPETTT